MASRILGMGDILSLVERAEKEADLDETKALARKLRKQEFGLEDFKKQLVQMKKMGSLSHILSLLPESGPFKNVSKMNIDGKKILYYEAIINSMTPEEREDPKMISGSRRMRIAKGSGRPVSEVNQLLKQFLEMRKMMKKSQFQKILSGVS
jgi:signal recognition particle subunit SRP54